MLLIHSLYRRIIPFSASRQGGIAVTFAILVPFILAMIALFFDSVQLVGKRARLADAMNEGILAVASRGETDEASNVRLLTEYLRGYLPEANKFTNVSVKISQQDGCATYTGSATAEVNTFIRYGGFSGFDKNVNVSYNSDACRKKDKMINGDFVFIVDMSASMTGKKLKELKRLLKETINTGKKTPNTRFGLVPFGNGVPVKLSGKNERGGEIAGCSVLFVPNSNYNIDYQYWSSIRATNYSKLEKNAHFADRYRYHYYKYYVSPTTSSANLNATRNAYCFINTNKGDYKSGNYKYSCMSNKFDESGVTVPLSMVFKDLDAYRNLTAKTLHPTYERELEKAYKIRREAAKGRNRNIAHDNSIDYQATLDRMFIPDGQPGNAITTFYHPWTSTSSRYRPFRKMCRMIKGKRSTFANAKVHTRLFELSSNLDDLEEIDDEDLEGEGETVPEEEEDVDGEDQKNEQDEDDEDDEDIDDDDIDDMETSGLTDTMSGFMRAIPVIAAGQSPNKSLIIISDGGDNSNIKMRDKLIDSYKICEKVKDAENYKTYAPKTEKVEIYFILLGSKGAHKKHVERWRGCVGANNVYHAPDSAVLQEVLFDITTKDSGDMVTFQ
jgi:tight adherence protein G